MRARGGNAEPPGAQVPDDRGDEQREHHRVAGGRADLENELDRQQRHDAEGDGAGRGQHAEEVPAARPHDRDLGRQGVGIDDGRDGVGGVVEAVDEFEAERDQQRDAEQEERQDRRRSAAGRRNVRSDRIGHVEQAEREDGEDAQRKPEIDRMIEMRLHRRYGGWPESSVECGGHEISLARLRHSIATLHDRNVKAATEDVGQLAGTCASTAADWEKYLMGKKSARALPNRRRSRRFWHVNNEGGRAEWASCRFWTVAIRSPSRASAAGWFRRRRCASICASARLTRSASSTCRCRS